MDYHVRSVGHSGSKCNRSKLGASQLCSCCINSKGFFYICIPARNGLKTLSTFRPECSGLLQCEDVIDLTRDVMSKDTCVVHELTVLMLFTVYRDAHHVRMYVRMVCSRVLAQSLVNSLWNCGGVQYVCAYLEVTYYKYVRMRALVVSISAKVAC